MRQLEPIDDRLDLIAWMMDVADLESEAVAVALLLTIAPNRWILLQARCIADPDCEPEFTGLPDDRARRAARRLNAAYDHVRCRTN